MFVVDTNILVYAAEKTFPEHQKARSLLERWMQSREPWFVTWGILYEFMRVTTHPAVFPKPMNWNAAKRFVDAILDASNVRILIPTSNHRNVLRQVVLDNGDLTGNLIHDAHTAVLMREHGIPEIRTRDKHFTRFRFLKVVDPLG